MPPAILFAVTVVAVVAGLGILATAYTAQPPETFLGGYGPTAGIALILIGCIFGIALEVAQVGVGP